MRYTTSWQRVNWTLLALIGAGACWLCAPVRGQGPAADHALHAAVAGTPTTQVAVLPAFHVAANVPTDGEPPLTAEALPGSTTKPARTASLNSVVSALIAGPQGAATPVRVAGPAAAQQPVEVAGRQIASESTAAITELPAASGAALKDINGGVAAAIPHVVPPQEKLPLGHAGPAPAEKPERKAGAESSWWMTTATALGIVIGLILILRSVVKRWSGRNSAANPSPLVEVLARVAVAPRNHVLLVRLGPRVLVLGDSQAGLQLLANIEDGDEVAGLLATLEAGKPNSISRGFGQLMRKMTGDFHREQELDDQGADVGEYLVDHSREEISGLTARLRSLGQRERHA